MTVIKAIQESAADQANVRSAVRQRNKWAYVSETELLKWATSASVTGANEALVREFFKDHMIAMALKTMPESEQKKIISTKGIPPTYNPSAVVETGPNIHGETFYAIWVARGEPDTTPTF